MSLVIPKPDCDSHDDSSWLRPPLPQKQKPSEGFLWPDYPGAGCPVFLLSFRISIVLSILECSSYPQRIERASSYNDHDSDGAGTSRNRLTSNVFVTDPRDPVFSELQTDEQALTCQRSSNDSCCCAAFGAPLPSENSHERVRSVVIVADFVDADLTQTQH